MNKDINIKTIKSTYTVDEEDKSVYCYKSVVLSLYGEEKHFYGEGVSYCVKGNIFNIPFGKALAAMRATQEITRRIEIALIKYSFDHFLEEQEEPTDFLSDFIFGKIMPGDWVIR